MRCKTVLRDVINKTAPAKAMAVTHYLRRCGERTEDACQINQAVIVQLEQVLQQQVWTTPSILAILN